MASVYSTAELITTLLRSPYERIAFLMGMLHSYEEASETPESERFEREVEKWIEWDHAQYRTQAQREKP